MRRKLVRVPLAPGKRLFVALLLVLVFPALAISASLYSQPADLCLSCKLGVGGTIATQAARGRSSLYQGSFCGAVVTPCTACGGRVGLREPRLVGSGN